jgi:hypothetical protein
MAINLKHVRYARFTRVRHARHLLGFLSGEATALASSATGRTVAPTLAAQTTANALATFAGQPANGETLKVGNVTYTFKTAIVSAFDVLIGAAASNTRDNLVAAITAGAGAGTTYGTGTTAHPLVTAVAESGNARISALLAPDLTPGKAVALVSTAANVTVPATLRGPTWTATAHGFTDAEGPVRITNSGGALPTGTPTGDLYVHVIDTNTVAFAVSREALQKGNFIGNSTAGTGTQTATRSVTSAGILGLLKRNTAGAIKAATDIDSLK